MYYFLLTCFFENTCIMIKKKPRNISSPKWKNDKKTNFNIIEFYSYTFFAYNCKLNILIIVYRKKKFSLACWSFSNILNTEVYRCLSVKKGNIICICERMQAINIFKKLNLLSDLLFVIKFNMLIHVYQQPFVFVKLKCI